MMNADDVITIKPTINIPVTPSRNDIQAIRERWGFPSDWNSWESATVWFAGFDQTDQVRYSVHYHHPDGMKCTYEGTPPKDVTALILEFAWRIREMQRTTEIDYYGLELA